MCFNSYFNLSQSFSSSSVFPDRNILDFLLGVEIKGPWIFLVKSLNFSLETFVFHHYVRVYFLHCYRAIAFLTCCFCILEEQLDLASVISYAWFNREGIVHNKTTNLAIQVFGHYELVLLALWIFYVHLLDTLNNVSNFDSSLFR